MIQTVKKREELETKMKLDKAVWEFCGNPVNIMDSIGAWNIKIEHFDNIMSVFSFGFKYSKKANACAISIKRGEENMLIQFYKGGTRNLKVVGEFDNIPPKELKLFFERFTGLEIIKDRR